VCLTGTQLRRPEAWIDAMDNHPSELPADARNDSAGPSLVLQILERAGWDGALPLVVAAAPLIVKAIFPNPPVAAGVFLVLSPPVAAMIRAHIGWQQIALRCGGRAPWMRQIAMALAIMLLCVFEGSVTILTFDNGAPADAWLVPIGTFAGYLVMINFALRPVAGNRPAAIVHSESS
jgi:hypothetical protein